METTHEATEKVTIRFTKIGEKETRVEMVSELDLSKKVGSEAVKDCLEKYLAKVTKAAFYFNNLLEGEELKEEDGNVVGEQLMLRLKEREKGKSKEEAVKAFIKENKALRDLAEKYTFFDQMLIAIVVISPEAAGCVRTGTVVPPGGRQCASDSFCTMH